jgi:hypothetical protein
VVDKAVFQGFFSTEPAVAVAVFRNLFGRFARRGGLARKPAESERFGDLAPIATPDVERRGGSSRSVPAFRECPYGS